MKFYEIFQMSRRDEILSFCHNYLSFLMIFMCYFDDCYVLFDIYVIKILKFLLLKKHIILYPCRRLFRQSIFPVYFIQVRNLT